jgi:hypothetical protein
MYDETIKYIQAKLNIFERDVPYVPTYGQQHEIDHLREMIRNIHWIDDERKAARWIGWMLKSCEFLGLFDNEKSRELIAIDIALGNDRRIDG